MKLSMQAQFEATLQAKREEAARTKEELQAQLQAQNKLLRQTHDEVRDINSRFDETNALLRAVLNLQKQ
jgi:signal transduction histidine kinase